MGYQTIAIELLSSFIIAKIEEYSVLVIVRQLNIQLRVTGEVYGNITLEQKLLFLHGSGL